MISVMTSPAVDVAPEGLPAAGPCVEDDLGWALGTVFRRYVKNSATALADVPGGPRGYQVLTTAGMDTPKRQLDLANRLGVDRTVMTYLLDDLERDGLVERQPDPADRRARLIVLTDKGTTTLAELEGRLAGVENDVLGTLDQAERVAFRSLLQRIATNSDPLDHPRDKCSIADELTGNKDSQGQ